MAQGHPVEPLRAATEQAGRYTRVVPSLVVELDVDMAFEQHRWRHAARLVRLTSTSRLMTLDDEIEEMNVRPNTGVTRFQGRY